MRVLQELGIHGLALDLVVPRGADLVDDKGILGNGQGVDVVVVEVL